MPEEQIIKKSVEGIKSKETPGKKESREQGLDLDLEKSLEGLDKKSEKKQKEVSEQISTIISEDQGAPQAGATLPREERERQIENFLAGGLEKFYLQMSAEEQKEFKRAGEKTAREINSLLDKAKIKAKKVIDLIKKWLSLIPGVSKFFLEQEAKIRADKIMNLRK